MDTSDENKICDLLENIINRQKQLERSLEELKRERATPWMDIQETAQYLRMGVSTIRKLVYAGNIPYIRKNDGLGASKLYFHKKQVDLWMLTGNIKPTKHEQSRVAQYLN